MSGPPKGQRPVSPSELVDRALRIAGDGEILAIVRSERRVGESIYDTAQRLLTVEVLLAAEGRQFVAAELAGISRRQMNYRASDLQLGNGKGRYADP